MRNKNPTFPGRLLYVIGASGVGKDSLINEVFAQAEQQDKILIAPRLVTRLSQPSGNDVALSKHAFQARQKAGAFLFHWQAHGFEYGIENSVLSQLKTGCNLLVNGSREYIANARKIHPQVIIVGVKADQQHLQARLKKRGRENTAVIAERLARNRQYHEVLQQADFVIDNQQSLDQAAADLLQRIRKSG